MYYNIYTTYVAIKYCNIKVVMVNFNKVRIYDRFKIKHG